MTNNLPSWPGWTVDKAIGRGGFGTVYEISRKLPVGVERAALKVIDIPENEDEIQELYADGYQTTYIAEHVKNTAEDIVNEYSLMLQLKGYSNIVCCDDLQYFPHDDGIGWRVCIKMELLTPLKRALDGKYNEEQVIQIGKDICQALRICQQKSIIHRDIKPENIFVSEDGVNKLGDFGVARVNEKTASGTKIGTYDYMAPEVYNNQPQTTLLDMYSLGLVLYYLMNNRTLPFLPYPPEVPTTTQKEVARSRRFQGEKLPEPANGSDKLKRIVMKACAFDPKDRFTSVDSMLEALNSEAEPEEKLNLDVKGTVEFKDGYTPSGKQLPYEIDGESVLLEYPWNVTDGQIIRFAGKGKKDPYSDRTGDLYLTVHIKPAQIIDFGSGFGEGTGGSTGGTGGKTGVNKNIYVVIAAVVALVAVLFTVFGKSKKPEVPPSLNSAPSATMATVAAAATKAHNEVATEATLASIEAETEAAAKEGIILRVANCNEWITLHARDDAYSEELFKIPLNEKALYLTDGNNGFTKVEYNGIIGYVMSKYVLRDSTSDNIAVFEVFESKTMKVDNCKESVTLRDKASETSGEILQVPLGSRVEVCDFAQNGFYLVQYQGHSGYIMAKYLEY